jgi:putative redox protein
MEVIARYMEDSKFEVTARGQRVICDQPIDNGGSNQGMSPPEFLLASLAACAAYYATQYLKTRGLPADDLKVRVIAEKAEQPARLASFQIEVTMQGLDDRHQAGMLRAVKTCLIHNTLLGRPSIEVAVSGAVCAAV